MCDGQVKEKEVKQDINNENNENNAFYYELSPHRVFCRLSSQAQIQWINNVDYSLSTQTLTRPGEQSDVESGGYIINSKPLWTIGHCCSFAFSLLPYMLSTHISWSFHPEVLCQTGLLCSPVCFSQSLSGQMSKMKQQDRSSNTFIRLTASDILTSWAATCRCELSIVNLKSYFIPK